MNPAELIDLSEQRLYARDGRGFLYGIKHLAARLGLDAEIVKAGVIALEWSFGRVVQSEANPRCFELAETGGVPVALIPVFPLDWSADGAADVLALALSGGRFWRFTLGCTGLGLDDAAIQGHTLRLFQDAHGYVRQVLRVAARDARAKRAEHDANASALARFVAPIKASAILDGRGELCPSHPCWAEYGAAVLKVRVIGEEAHARVCSCDPVSSSRGALILDPGAFDWTRRGVLRDIETIEILDAPSTGSLGRALRRINPMIGTPRGADMIGETAQRRAA